MRKTPALFYCLTFRAMVENVNADREQAKKGSPRITKVESF
ncbi:MAG: hypothetical protein WD555_03035 [Fulvivirga sp.]